MPSIPDPSSNIRGRIERLEILKPGKSLKFRQVEGPFQAFAEILANTNGETTGSRSDLVDAISFILGVRALRLPGTEDLVAAAHSPRRGVAFVKLVFRTGSGEEVKFGRRITSSGTSEYRINNIPVTWDIYHNTMKGLDLLGEFDADVFQKEITPDVVKKPPVQPVMLEPNQKVEMVPTQQKRMMFAQQRKLEREKTMEPDAALRHRAEMDMKAAEARMKVDAQADSLPVETEKPLKAPESGALDQYNESVRENERKSLERAEAARRAVTAFQVADKRHKLPAKQPSSRPSSRPTSLPPSRPSSRPPSRPISPVPTFPSRPISPGVPMFGPSRPASPAPSFPSRPISPVPTFPSRPISPVPTFPSRSVSRVEAEVAHRRSKSRFNPESVQQQLAPVQTRSSSSSSSRRRQASLDGTISPGLAEERRQQHTPRQSSWPGATTPPHILRTLQDYDDQLYWHDSPPHNEKDSLSKAEELAEELYKEAMEIHDRFVAEDAKAQSIETKETCGEIMYTDNSRSQDIAPLALIPAENSESRSVSFSQTSQCSDTLGERAPVLNFTGLEKELARVKASNVRKQAKIDSLQKWRAYYQSQLESKDRVLQKLEKKHTKELTKKEKALKKLEKAHTKDVAHRELKREATEEKLRSDIRELNLVIEELSGQLYDMEEHLAAGGIPYKPAINENTGPSSKTLLSAVIGVKEAAHTFSRTFMSYLKQHLTKASDLDEQICLESEVIVARPSDYKFLVQSFILRRMFLDFDSECFNIDSCMTEIFDIEEHSRACFQEFMSHRNVSETVTLLTDNRPHSGFLREFCFKKFLHIVSESTEEAFFGDFNHSDDICAGRHPSSRFYESYCRLAVSVWLLHRLAFSFQPPARMISVRKGAQFNPTYMESAVPGISSGALGDDGAALPFEALVGLMVHPGFRVGSSVIRAQVYLVTT